MQTADGSRERSSTGLDVNLAAALTYVLGFVTGIVFLLIEKDSKFVRFHAMQSTLVFLAVMILNVVINVIPFIGWMLSVFLLWPLSVALWLVLIFKAFQGEKFKLPYFGDLAESKI
jgi:uncharacterized membrane protein